MRFSEDNPEDLDRARAAVAVWREKYPDKTADQLVTELGPEFHPEYEPVLRGMLFRYDEDHAGTTGPAVSITVTSPATNSTETGRP